VGREKIKALRYLLYMLRIRRIEFRIAEIPILAIPVLLLVNDTAPLRTYTFWEGVLIFFLLFAFGDMINCLADRDLDAVYKPHLSEAVYGLGVPFVTFQVAATAALALILSAHLSWRMNRWPLFALVAIGLALGAAYSVQPVQLKGRGLAQLFCLWLIIFVGPMIFVGLLVSAVPSPAVLLFSAAYGTLQMGIILINTAEDYPEDLEAGIKTTIVALGLERGIALALWLTIGGAAGVLVTLGLIFYGQRRTLPSVPSITALLLVAAACLYVTRDVWKLRRAMRGSSLADNIQTVKRAAKRVPFWVTVVAWSSLSAAFILFYLK
jgi:4-hydroxybenzoate polyprenyltransferase